MRKEYPVFWAKVSTAIGTPILFVVLILFVQRAITQPSATVYPLAVTAFGITAALSGICFRMASLSPEGSTARYAGEKFLHSSLLLIQALFLIYVKESIITLSWMNSHGTVKTVVSGIAGAIIFLLSGTATVCWYHGFSALNLELWQNWKSRIEDINKTQKGSGSGKSPEGKENV